MVDFPTLGRPTIPQFRGIVLFPCFAVPCYWLGYEAVSASWVSFIGYLFADCFVPIGRWVV